MRSRTSRLSFVAGLALAVAVPGAGSAQDRPGSTSGELVSRLGTYLLVGGGVADFTEEGVKDRFGIGGTWDVRLGVGNRLYVGGELGYVGAVRSGDGFESDLLSNGVEGVLRLQYPYETGRWLVEPFVFGGVGYSRVSLRDAPAGLADEDDVGVVPFGAGITLGHDRLLFDARFTYRTPFEEDLALRAGERAVSQEQWAIGASVGYAF